MFPLGGVGNEYIIFHNYLYTSQRVCDYSDLYPIGEHFFYIGCIDGSKSYNPESGIVFDLATAYAFFGLDPAATFKKIKEEAGEVVSGWNEAYSKREVSKIMLYLLLLHTRQKLCFYSSCETYDYRQNSLFLHTLQSVSPSFINYRIVYTYQILFRKEERKSYCEEYASELLFCLQDFQNRSHCANYFVLSTHTKLVIEPGVGGGIKRRLAGGGPSSSTSGKSVTTELVCVVSNWHFNRTAATKDAIVKCKLTDVNVSLKFASDQWKKIGAARERFHFDRDGVSMSYSTLLSLISDKQFTHNFLPEARKKYEQVEQCDLLVTDQSLHLITFAIKPLCA